MANENVEPLVGSLVASGQAPRLAEVRVPVGALVLASQAPRGDLNLISKRGRRSRRRRSLRQFVEIGGKFIEVFSDKEARSIEKKFAK